MIIKGRKLLLIKRGVNPFKGYWATPGGYVDWNETTEETVKREVKEELNLTVTETKLIGVYSKPERHPKQAINLAYLVKVEGILKTGDDALEAKWFSLNSLPRLAFDHAEIIKDAKKLLK